MPVSIPPSDDANHERDEADNQARAAQALQAAFDRLAPQGSDAWNFLAAFTHLGDRYGPYQPGASALSEALGRAERDEGRAASRRGRRGRDATGPSELEEAMAQVVEAFRFLSARVQTLEHRLARQDRPIDGAAWLVPATELGALSAPLAAHLAANTGGRPVLHGDCGAGDLLVALEAAGVAATGAEPRGSVALGAIERGADVVMAELHEVLAARPDSSLGGLVLSGVVDRVPLHELLALLAQSQRALGLSASLVVVTGAGAGTGRDAVAAELLGGAPLARATWEILLGRAGFVDIAVLETGDAGMDGPLVLTAATPS